MGNKSWQGVHSCEWLRKLSQAQRNMAATRLRKTFQYPTDNSDDDDTPKDLDDEGCYKRDQREWIVTDVST